MPSSRALGRLVAGAAAAAVLAVPAAARADDVRLYEHANLQGNSFVPSDNDADFRRDTFGCVLWWGCSNFNDRVSSLHVPAYTCVTLYEHINFGGASTRFCANNLSPNGSAREFNLSGFWNDRASSAFTVGQIIQA